MNTYIALLRGINVGGHKKIKMVDLKETFHDIGCADVKTYIQSGNVVFKDPSENVKAIASKIKTAIEECFGFDVPVIVITTKEIEGILKNNPFLESLEKGLMDKKKMYFMLLADTPNSMAVEELQTISYNPESFVIAEYVIYLFATNGYGKTKLNNTFFEKKLGCEITTRNLKTMHKLLEMSI